MTDLMPTGQPPRRPGGRNARTRAALLDAAVAELLEVGYGRFRLESVAARAGVHKTTVYRRWPARSALIAEALLDKRSADVPIPDSGSLRQDLRLLANAVATSITAPVGETLTRTLVAEAGHIPEAAAALREFWTERSRLASTVVERAVERGELPPDSDATQLIEALIGPLYLRLLISGDTISDAYIDRLVDLLLAGSQQPRT